MALPIISEPEYELLLVKTVELETEYDYLHFYLKLKYQGQVLEFCLQFADFLEAMKYHDYNLYHYIDKLLHTNEFWSDCDEALLERLKEIGLELPHLVKPLLENTDIMQLWEHTTGVILGEEAGLRKVTKAEWRAHYLATDHFKHVPGLHISYNDIHPAFYEEAVKLCLQYFPELREMQAHCRRDVRVAVQEFVSLIWDFFQLCEYHSNVHPKMSTNKFKEKKAEMRENLFRWRSKVKDNPMFCVEPDAVEYLWDFTGENETLIGYKLTTATGEFYHYVEMSDLQQLARVEFPKLFKEIWAATVAVKGIGNKEREIHEYLKERNFDWTPLLAAYIADYVEIRGEEEMYGKFLKEGLIEPGVRFDTEPEELEQEGKTEMKPFLQKQWLLHDDLFALIEPMARKEFPKLFEMPLNGGYWYFYYHNVGNEALELAHTVAHIAMAHHGILSNYEMRYD